VTVSRINTHAAQPRAELGGHRLALAAVGLSLVAGLWITPVHAQDGGTVLSFGVAQRFEASDNLELDDPSAGNSFSSTTRLSFGLVSETALSRFTLDASAGLVGAFGPGSSLIDEGLVSPGISFNYDRSVASANLNVTGSLNENSITNNNTVALTDPTADPSLLDVVSGGKVRTHSLDATLNFRQDTPLSFGVTAGLSGTRYTSATDPTLIDNNSTRAGITASLALSEVATAKFGLRYSTYKEDTAGAPLYYTKGFDAGIEFERPDGIASADFSTDHRRSGNRNRLSFKRSVDRPDGQFSAEIGAVRTLANDVELMGELAYSQEFPLGTIDASLRRDNVVSNKDTEYNITTVSLGYNRDLTAVSSLRLDIGYTDSEQTNISTTTTYTNFGVTYTHQMTKDWGLDVGYDHSRRHKNGTTGSSARSNTVFVELRRIFEYRP
jgi:hypothetical protein